MILGVLIGPQRFLRFRRGGDLVCLDSFNGVLQKLDTSLVVERFRG